MDIAECGAPCIKRFSVRSSVNAIAAAWFTATSGPRLCMTALMATAARSASHLFGSLAFTSPVVPSKVERPFGRLIPASTQERS